MHSAWLYENTFKPRGLIPRRARVFCELCSGAEWLTHIVSSCCCCEEHSAIAIRPSIDYLHASRLYVVGDATEGSVLA